MKFIQRVWHTWKRIGGFIGDMIARVILTIFYFTVFMPFGLGIRMLMDPLGIGPGTRAKWLERNTRDNSIEDTRRLS
jgi:hypothetical protein